jgi:drug/metabolite transporter (DMT)-like permease
VKVQVLAGRKTFLSSSRSLLLTGLAEVWGALGERPRGGSQGSGLVLMVVSAAAFAFMAALVKKLLPDTPIQAIVLSRGLLLSGLFCGLAIWRKAPIWGHRPSLLAVRGLLGYAALSCYFWSVHHLPLGDAVLLQYSHPVFVALIAPFFLHERTGRGHWWLVAVALVGVTLIVRPSGAVRHDALVGVLGSMLSGLAYITIRELSRSEHPLTILVWFPLATVVPSLVATVATWPAGQPRNATEWAAHGLVAVTALIGQVTLTVGLTRVGAARATAVTLTGPVFGMLFGLLLFGTVPAVASLVGTALVLTAVWLLGRSRLAETRAATGRSEPERNSV